MPDMPPAAVNRPPDAGTRNEWTFVGDGKVFVFRAGLPAVLGRPAQRAVPVVLMRIGRGHDAQVVVVTPHQARALMEILPAVIAKAEEEDE